MLIHARHISTWVLIPKNSVPLMVMSNRM